MTSRVAAARVIAIVRSDALGPEIAVRIAGTLAEAGLDVVEFTCNAGATLEAIAAVAGRFGDDICVGAGTVLSAHEVHQVADAGGQFVVSPDLDVEVVAATRTMALASVPGIYTATEVRHAMSAGADLLKLFPAGPAGPAYVGALLGPFPDARLVPTGGIELDDVPAFIRGGAVAVGLGSALVAPTDPVAELSGRVAQLRAGLDALDGPSA